MIMKNLFMRNSFMRNLSNPSVCRLIALVLFFSLMFTVSSHAAPESTLFAESHDEVVHSCGPASLSTVLSLLGHSVDAAQCAKLAGTDPNGVTTLAGLQSAARVLGVSAKGLNITTDELASVGGPAILHCTLPNVEEHFMIFDSFSGGWFELIDPRRIEEKSLYTADQLRLMWNGNCIVFAKSPFLASLKAGVCRGRHAITAIVGAILGILAAILIASHSPRNRESSLHKMTASAPKSVIAVLGCTTIVAAGITLICMQGVRAKGFTKKGPRLTLGQSVLNIGDLKWGGSYAASIWIGNCGSDMLRIDKKKVMTSCTCLRVGISKLEINQGDKGELKFRVSPPKKMGPFQYSAYIPSNDPRGGKVVTIKGRVTGAGGVVYPPRLYFGYVESTERASRQLSYVLRRPNVRILNVTSDLPFTTCTFSKRNATAFDINVFLSELPKSSGPFAGTIKIVTNDPETEHAEIAVPFSGIVEELRGAR